MRSSIGSSNHTNYCRDELRGTDAYVIQPSLASSEDFWNNYLEVELNWEQRRAHVLKFLRSTYMLQVSRVLLSAGKVALNCTATMLRNDIVGERWSMQPSEKYIRSSEVTVCWLICSLTHLPWVHSGHITGVTVAYIMKQSAADRFARQQPNRTCCNIKDIDEHNPAPLWRFVVLLLPFTNAWLGYLFTSMHLCCESLVSIVHRKSAQKRLQSSRETNQRHIREENNIISMYLNTDFNLIGA